VHVDDEVFSIQATVGIQYIALISNIAGQYQESSENNINGVIDSLLR
jgi:hypothetical protein